MTARAGNIKPKERPDAIRLLAWLSDPANVSTVSESWFWKRWRDTSRNRAVGQLTLILATHAICSHRLTGAALRWPGDVGRTPDAKSQVVIIAAAWLRGRVALPGLDAPVEYWSDEAVARLAAELAPTSDLPWHSIDTRDKCRAAIKHATVGQYGGIIEVVVAPADWSARVATLIAP